MAAPVPLRWQATAMARAKQIAPEDWAAHEPEIRRRYEHTTLDEMMKAMKDTHGFKPTRRQYIHQLDKWGIRKYAQRDSKAVPVSRYPAQQLGRLDSAATAAFAETRPAAKRHGSFQGTKSRDSESQSPTLQDKKRLKHALQNSPVQAEVGFLRPIEYPSPIRVLPTSQTSGNYRSMPPSTSPRQTARENTNLEEQVGSGMDTPSFEEFTSRCVAGATKTMLAPADHLYPALEIAVKAREYHQKGMCTLLAEYDHRQIVHVAEYLFAALAREDALDIYAALRGLGEANTPWAEEMPLRTACARSAQLQSQCQRTQEAIVDRLQGSAGRTMSAPDRFLAHMRMVECYTAQNNLSDAGRHLEEAKTSVRNFRTLPAGQRNDTPRRLVYLYHKRYLMRSLEANQREAGASLECFDGAKVVSRRDFGKFVTTVFHRPNLELSLLESVTNTNSPGSPPLPYTRHCVSLCQEALESAENPPFLGFPGTLATHWDWKYIRWAETIALFTHVCHEWQTCYCTTPANQSWARQVQKHVGVSPTEALSIFCEMINLATPWERSMTDGSLLGRFHEGLALLQALSDEDLESKFLQLWYARTFRARGAEQYDAFLGPLPQCIRSPRQGIPATLTELEQRGKHHGQTRVVSNVNTEDLDPTLAPSCRSSDSSYQRFRDTASSVWHRLGHTIPAGDDCLQEHPVRVATPGPQTYDSASSASSASKVSACGPTSSP